MIKIWPKLDPIGVWFRTGLYGISNHFTDSISFSGTISDPQIYSERIVLEISSDYLLGLYWNMVHFLLEYSTHSNFRVRSFHRFLLVPMTKNYCPFGCYFSVHSYSYGNQNRHSFRVVRVTWALFLLMRKDIIVGRYKCSVAVESFFIKLSEYT